jgi:hypothetical protein
MAKVNPPPNTDGAEISRRLEERRRALKQLGLLSGLGAANLLFGSELKAAVSDLVHIGPTAHGAVAAAEKTYRPLATGTVPKIFTRDQLDVLAELVELIIPTTDTPGARTAGVHWYIDTVAEVNTKMRQQFMEGLAWLAQHCQQDYGKGFAALTDDQKVALLTDMSGSAPDASGKKFFELAKQWTLDGYYKSEIGMMQELGWVGHEWLAFFPGCPHSDPSHRRKE